MAVPELAVGNEIELDYEKIAGDEVYLYPNPGEPPVLLTSSLYKDPTTLQQTVSKQSTHSNPSPNSAYYLFLFLFLVKSARCLLSFISPYYNTAKFYTSHYTIKPSCRQLSHSFLNKWKIKEEMITIEAL